MMLLLAVVAGVVLLGSSAAAIQWDFDDGTTQGWSAKEAAIWGGTRELYLFPSVVEDGVWRITVDPYVTKSYYSSASISVTSSCRIGFSYYRVRFGSVRPRPHPLPHRP